VVVSFYLQVEGLGYRFPRLRVPLCVVYFIGEYMHCLTFQLLLMYNT